MDLLDSRILGLLNENGRMSYRVIAKKLKVSLSTVSNRIHRMEEKGIIKGYAPIIDTESLGYDLQAVIGIMISKG
ncbi:MAG: Lrp/AsnC family transcriptional regulator, partial [Thermoplasmata archaeon]